MRNSYFRRHRFCELCAAKGIARLADLVDHVRELEDGGAEVAIDNLMSLCRRCHASKTKRMAAARKHGYEAISALVDELKRATGGGGV